nr:hypothetical protein [Tanacetum cinerariifolium]
MVSCGDGGGGGGGGEYDMCSCARVSGGCRWCGGLCGGGGGEWCGGGDDVQRMSRDAMVIHSGGVVSGGGGGVLGGVVGVGEGYVVLRQSYKPESYGKLYYACPKSKPPNSTPPSSSSGPSTPPNYSPGSSRNAECSNCKRLRGKISVLKTTMDMHMHPEQHS